ncbi:Cytochrome P450 [Mycena sanguinolenta]|uniref:Cytochrome P450 n=1 Tax=Mycena sanguinolenta TaxID=230812 RepID=A0A8H6Z5G5_9AGAR|nr:Cytochrome P450 [Mycena sanguinolenta]
MDSRWTLIMTIAAIAVAYSLRKRRTPPLPPGPRGLPIVGNILDVPTSHPWLSFAKLGEIWGAPLKLQTGILTNIRIGEISSLTVFGQTMIIVNSLEIAEDLLETHGANFSDRPVMPMAGELMGFNNVLPLVQYGDRVKRERKLYHQLFGNSTTIISQFGPLLTSEVYKFLGNLLSKPEDTFSQIERMTGAITLRIAYGYNSDPDSQQDIFLEMFNTSVSNFSRATTPGAFLVDIFPALRYWPEWLPGGEFHTIAKEWSSQLRTTVDTSYEYVKEQMAAGKVEPSFTANLLEEGSHEEYLIKWAAAGIQGGGADTTAAQIKAFFLAVSLYPEVQAAAQEEIDTVVGTDRLPDISDRERLPYVNALCKEILRYHVSIPTGFPHRAREDFIYERGKGATPMLIPKDSLVIPNIWKMTHDPARYANPMVFDPTRFIEKTGKAAELDPTRISFGFGRRLLYRDCKTRLKALAIDTDFDARDYIWRTDRYTESEIAPLAHGPPPIEHHGRARLFVCTDKLCNCWYEGAVATKVGPDQVRRSANLFDSLGVVLTVAVQGASPSSALHLSDSASWRMETNCAMQLTSFGVVAGMPGTLAGTMTATANTIMTPLLLLKAIFSPDAHFRVPSAWKHSPHFEYCTQRHRHGHAHRAPHLTLSLIAPGGKADAQILLDLLVSRVCRRLIVRTIADATDDDAGASDTTNNGTDEPTTAPMIPLPILRMRPRTTLQTILPIPRIPRTLLRRALSRLSGAASMVELT